MKKRIFSMCVVLTLVTSVLAGCGKAAGGDEVASGISDDAAVRDYDDIDFDTVTIMDEEVPLGSSVANDNAEEMTELKNMAASIFAQMNQQRVNAGLSELTWDADLENAAAIRAFECTQSFSHTRPNGSAWYTVNAQIMHGENLAFGYTSAEAAMAAWMASPTHKENILWPSFTKAAVAIYKNGGTYYFAQEFRY